MPYPIRLQRLGALGGIRTHDLTLRRRLLYPIELQGHDLDLVRMAGFEPTTSASQTQRSTKLSYILLV